MRALSSFTFRQAIAGERTLSPTAEVDSFFADLLGSAPSREFMLDLDVLRVPSCDLSALEEGFSEEEIWSVVRSQELDKAPRPDGFTGRFYVACWDIIKGDVMEAFHSLDRRDVRGLGAANQALIALLPKRPGVVEVRDFRPVSLIHSFAKLVAKVLATQVAPFLPALVGPHQSAFVKGWCMHDNFRLVQG